MSNCTRQKLCWRTVLEPPLELALVGGNCAYVARGIDTHDTNVWIVNSPTSHLADWTAPWTSQVMDQSPHRLVKSRMTPLTETF